MTDENNIKFKDIFWVYLLILVWIFFLGVWCYNFVNGGS